MQWKSPSAPLSGRARRPGIYDRLPACLPAPPLAARVSPANGWLAWPLAASASASTLARRSRPVTERRRLGRRPMRAYFVAREAPTGNRAPGNVRWRLPASVVSGKTWKRVIRACPTPCKPQTIEHAVASPEITDRYRQFGNDTQGVPCPALISSSDHGQTARGYCNLPSQCRREPSCPAISHARCSRSPSPSAADRLGPLERRCNDPCWVGDSGVPDAVMKKPQE